MQFKTFFLTLSVALVIFKDILHAVGYSLLGTPLKKVAIGWSNTILQSLKEGVVIQQWEDPQHQNILLMTTCSFLVEHQANFSLMKKLLVLMCALILIRDITKF